MAGKIRIGDNKREKRKIWEETNKSLTETLFLFNSVRLKFPRLAKE